MLEEIGDAIGTLLTILIGIVALILWKAPIPWLMRLFGSKSDE